jgi:hypothetical protein
MFKTNSEDEFKQTMIKIGDISNRASPAVAISALSLVLGNCIYHITRRFSDEEKEIVLSQAIDSVKNSYLKWKDKKK